MTLVNGTQQFKDQKERDMTIEEFFDYCKTLFIDMKFIDNLKNFVKVITEEKTIKIYISTDKVKKIAMVVESLPLIAHRDKNISKQFQSLLVQESNREKAPKKALESIITDKHDPHLQKLLEMLC